MNIFKIGSDHTHNINMDAILDSIFKMAAKYICNVMKYILTNGRIGCVKYVVIIFSNIILTLEVILKCPDSYSGGHFIKWPP